MFPALALAFVLIPVAELAAIITVGEHIGVLPTIGLLLAFSLLGAWLARRQGWAAWRRFQLALAEGRVPAAEVGDGAMILLAAALLLTPGFLTDLVGLLLLVPVVRRLVRRWGARVALRRALQARRGGRVRGRVVVDGPAHETSVTWGKPEVDDPQSLPRR